MPKVDHTSPPWRVEQYRGSGRGPYVDIVADDPCVPGNCEGDCTAPCSMTERIGSTEGGDRPWGCQRSQRPSDGRRARPGHACRVAVSECKGCQGGDPDCGWPVCSIARAAIAKAKGE